MCRSKAVTDQDVPSLRFGLRDGVYYSDPRYSAYENFERGCSDLDTQLAEDADGVEVDWSPEVLAQAWNLLVAGAKLEPPESRPLFQQPVHSIEFDLVNRRMRASLMAVARSKGEKRSIYDACWSLFSHVHEVLQQEVTESELSRFTRPNHFRGQARLDNREDFHVYLRHDVEDFIHRTISRMLMMMQKRKCDQHGAGWHKHGGRDYYGDPSKCPEVQVDGPSGETAEAGDGVLSGFMKMVGM